MCHPAAAAAATAVSLGLQIAGTVAKNQQQGQTYVDTQANANRALAQNYNSDQLRANQEADKARSDSFDVARGMAEAKGRAVASAGEAGVGGVSFANIMSDLEMKEGRAKGNIDYNYRAGIQQINDEAEAQRSKTEAIIASTPKPSQLGLFAELGGAAAKTGLKIADIFDKSDGAERQTGYATYGPEFDL